MIHKIFYNNQSLRVSIPEFSEPSNSGCIAPVNNFSHLSRLFSIASNQKEVMLFYGCDLPSLPEEMEEHRIGCSAENRTRSVVAFYVDDPNSKLTTRNCKGQVVSTTVEDETGGIEEGMRRGFVLNWMAQNCSECSSNGGRCGFDYEVDAFRCYCGDRVDHSENYGDPLPAWWQ